MTDHGYTIPIDFDPATHTYTVNGNVIPSVTQVISRMCLSRFSEMQVACEEAAIFGTYVHEVTALYDEGVLNEEGLTPEGRFCLDSWAQFKSLYDTDPQPLREAILYSSVWQYAGTVDWVGFLHQGDKKRRRLAVVDIKTGSYDPSVCLQLAGYADLYADNYGGSPALLAVYLDKAGGPPKVMEFDRVRSRQLWQAALTLYRWKESAK
jgi:hypothetical protein